MDSGAPDYCARCSRTPSKSSVFSGIPTARVLEKSGESSRLNMEETKRLQIIDLSRYGMKISGKMAQFPSRKTGIKPLG